MRQRVPAGETVVLVDEDQWSRREAFADYRTLPFLERDGQYWGPPPDDATAIRELERLRRAGANYLVFARPAFWWLDHYADLHRHIRAKYARVLQNERLVLFDLGPR